MRKTRRGMVGVIESFLREVGESDGQRTGRRVHSKARIFTSRSHSRRLANHLHCRPPIGFKPASLPATRSAAVAAFVATLDGIDATAKNIAAACRLTRGERRGMAHLPAVHRARRTRELSVNHIATIGKPSP